MGRKEEEAQLLERLGRYLVSLPFDLKILQEAVTDLDLEKKTRVIVAGTVIHTLLPQEGTDLTRYVDDVLLVRAALARVLADGGEAALAFRERFSDVYETLDEDVKLFQSGLGDLWPWLVDKLDGFARLQHKGKTAVQCAETEEAATFLYEENEVFQTNYNVSEEQVHNRLRRMEQVLEALNRRRSDDLKKKA